MSNRLINEQSPYLLQHAHNPVEWYPWGDEAFAQARAQNKPVLVSIGYAACHWCHVMERESFEDAAVAAYMNEHFVCIKVDREEHPDVDHLYMDAVQAISGAGGWPLNVFVTPERAPFYGGTYYPPRPAFNRPSWSQVLGRINEIWHENHDEVAAQAHQMIQHLRQASARITPGAQAGAAGELCRQAAGGLLAMADKEKGGFGNAPKFPGTMAISYLIEHYRYTRNEEALQQALRSLDAMIAGGIYDQLGGGFARYSTDSEWLAPHFEKMLYDNALLVLSLCDAYLVRPDARYAEVIAETIAFAERELSNGAGGYTCALDADSEGVEGKFYTWTWDEWKAHSGDDSGVAAKYFGISERGNWEHTNILHVTRSIPEIAANTGRAENEVKALISSVKLRLADARARRVRPATDDKSLLSWNALMNLALCRAAAVLQRDDYRQRAIDHMEWMLSAFRKDDSFLHVWKAGVARIPAKLDDLAYLAQAMLQLGSVSGEERWLVGAAGIVKNTVAAFGRDDGFFYYTPVGQQDIPVRKVDLYDGATPSANAVMAHNLWICGMCMENPEWMERAGAMVNAMSSAAARYAYSFGYWALLLQRQAAGMKTAICSGQGAAEAVDELHARGQPEIFSIKCEKELSELPIMRKKFTNGCLSVYVCTEEACLAPLGSVGAVLEMVNGG